MARRAPEHRYWPATHIATTTVGAVVVSTVRLRPGLYETMVLNAAMVDLEMVRHHSHVSAIRGHMATVAKLRNKD